MIWFSLLVLIPLAALVVTAAAGGWDQYVTTLTNPQTWAAIRLTVGQALLVTLLNIVMGTVIAWVLVRDRFPGKAVLDVIIDIPFALPTIVAGLVLLVALRHRTARSGWSGPTPSARSRWRWPSSRCRSSCAPSSRCSRSSRPTSRRRPPPWARGGCTIFRRIILPSLVPAIAAGAALVVRPGDLRVRLAGAAQRQPAVQDRGRVGPGADASSRTATPRRPPRSPR